jgi:dTDP-4-dehydrorhamnose reductase
MSKSFSFQSMMIIAADSKLGQYFYNYLRFKTDILTFGTSYKNPKFLKLDLLTSEYNIPSPQGRGIALIFAAKTDHAFCEEFPKESYYINVTKNLILTKYLNSMGWETVHFSSTQVFSGIAPWVSVSDVPDPISAFGKQKADLEKNLSKFQGNIVIRVTKVLNLNDDPFSSWLVNLRNQRLIQPFKDYPISPISPSSFLDGTFKILENFNSGVWHLGSSEQCDYAKVAFLLSKHLNYDTNLVKSILKSNKINHSPKYASLDTSTTQKLTSWKPETISNSIDQAVLDIA